MLRVSNRIGIAESDDPEVTTIVKVLGCVEKTVRNRRDKALKALQAALAEEAGS